MKVKCNLSPEEVDSLLAWLDDQYSEMYPDMETINEQQPALIPAIMKLQEALDDAN